METNNFANRLGIIIAIAGAALNLYPMYLDYKKQKEQKEMSEYRREWVDKELRKLRANDTAFDEALNAIKANHNKA